MADDTDIEPEVEPDEIPEEVMHGPDGALDCINGRYDFIAYWLDRLGVDDPRGAALTFGENCSLSILHPVTGEWLTPQQIVKLARASTQPTRIQ